MIALLWAALASGCGKSTPSATADERDRQVLEVVLLHCLTNSEFDLAGVSTNRATIVLDSRTPGGNRLFQPDVWRPHDIGPGHTVPTDMQRDAARRNGDLPASFSGFTFGERILVTELPRSRGRSVGPRDWFERGHPDARAYVHAWLPGYSADGARALVRAWTGPTAHGALLTVVVEKSGDRWSVKWSYLERFQ